METQKILVTEGKGFIESNHVSELESGGHKARVRDLGHSEEENYIRCNVSKYRQLERVLEEKDIFLKIWRCSHETK